MVYTKGGVKIQTIPTQFNISADYRTTNWWRSPSMYTF